MNIVFQIVCNHAPIHDVIIIYNKIHCMTYRHAKSEQSVIFKFVNFQFLK